MLPKHTSETLSELDPNELTFIYTQFVLFVITLELTTLATEYLAHTLQYPTEY
jgi:hypothetical protein